MRLFSLGSVDHENLGVYSVAHVSLFRLSCCVSQVLEIEGLPDLTCEQAFELSDASAERSAAGCVFFFRSVDHISWNV